MNKPIENRRALVTGGAGFIGSHLVKRLLAGGYSVLTVDSLSYAGSLGSLEGWVDHPEHGFVEGDICDGEIISDTVFSFKPDWIFHLAAETHVDRSICDPMQFFRTNVIGTANLLDAATRYWSSLTETKRSVFRFIHTSTDEVFGSIQNGGSFDESSPYAPGSPYSASKAASDHAVRAWGNTYGLPIIVTNCSNNYGPYQFPEKLIPVVILKALRGESIPVYGKGENVRDWLHVEDHCDALSIVAEKGRIGGTYVISGGNEWRNIDLVKNLCGIVQEFTGNRPSIEFVEDRKGHDFRYSLDASKIRNELNWEPRMDFSEGIRETVNWYLCNQQWWEPAVSAQEACTHFVENLPTGK